MTLFNRKINNWILWIPVNGVIWSPQNINSVWSRGFEGSIAMKRRFGNGNIRFGVSYDYTKSTNQVSISLPRIDAGSQLIYVPVHKASLFLTHAFRNISFDYNHMITSKVQGINEEVPQFMLANIGSSISTKHKNWNGLFYFNIKNIWNSNYIIVERRPMPRRSIEFGIQLKL